MKPIFLVMEHDADWHVDNLLDTCDSRETAEASCVKLIKESDGYYFMYDDHNQEGLFIVEKSITELSDIT